MSAVVSTSAGRRYGLARVCRVWDVARSGVHRLRRAAAAPPAPRRRPGPAGPMPDTTLVEAIRRVLTDSPFHGEGHREAWAWLRHAGLRASKERVRRLMRENALSAATRVGRPRGPRAHEGTIIPKAVDAMWGTDMTATFTLAHGQVAFGQLTRPHRSHGPRVARIASTMHFISPGEGRARISTASGRPSRAGSICAL